MNKKHLSERDICTKFITPALEQVGWDVHTQIREEFPITKGRIIVRGKLHTRAKHKRADYVLFYKPNIPIAVIEVKDNNHSIGDGMQQGLGYAEMLHEVEVNHRDPEELMAEYQQIVHQLEAAQAALKAELMACLSVDKRGKA